MTRPNILILLTDDHGAWAMPRHGDGAARHLHAPSLAWLQDTGTTMRQAFTPNPVCSPARASFWSGLLPSAHGIHDFLHEGVTVCHEHPGLTDRNLGQQLQAAGYHTMLAGKWHCGGNGQVQPGFDRWSSMTAGTNARFGVQPFCIDGEAVERIGHQAPMIGDEAVRFLRERPDDQPFFCFVGMTDTHSPFNQAPPRLCHLYGDVEIEPPHDETFAPCHGKARFSVAADPEQQRRELIDYLASVTAVDEQIGRLIDELRSQQVLDDTLIVYTADHGHLNGQCGLMAKGNSSVPQNLLDGSVRVPCVWNGPGVPAGATRDAPVDHCDLHVTLATMAGAEVDEPLCPGSDYWPVVAGEASDWRDWQVAEYGNARMWRTPEWKFIQRFPGPNGHFGDELYDLTADPHETVNVIAGHAELAASFRELLDTHFASFERPENSGARIADRIPSAAASPWLLDPSA